MVQPTLTVFVPAYNEAAGLETNMRDLAAALDRLAVSWEILIVDDGSGDETGEAARGLSLALPGVRTLRHDCNLGIGGALLTAIGAARGEWLILIPADLALDPVELHKYLDAAAGADVVVGVRSDRSDYSGWRLLVSAANIALIRLLFGMRERQFNYISMYRLAVLRGMQIVYWRSAFFHAETLIKAKALGYRLVEVEIHYVPRLTGHASGARPGFVLATLRDMLDFWFRSRLLPWAGHSG